MKKPIFRSAITDENGDVDVGYLALIWGLIGWATATVVVLLIAIYTIWRNPTIDASVIIKSIGDAMIGISTGFAAMLGAVGLFRFGDSRTPPLSPGKTTTKSETVTETAPPAALATAAKPMPVIVKNPDPVAVRVAKPKGKR